MNTVDKVIAIAKSEVGYLEKSKSAYKANPDVLYSKTEGAGSDNYTKYGKEMHAIYPAVMDFPAYWCDCFVDWCFQSAYGVANAKGLLGGNFDDYTKGSIQLYKSKSAFFLRGAKAAQAGDQVFFTKDNTFNGVHHTGLVVAVDSSRIFTIEGNSSGGSEVIPNGGAVVEKSYGITDNRIYGYGRPKYDIPKVGWSESNGLWKYQKADGTYAIQEWLKINNHWYRFDARGYALTGIHTVMWNGVAKPYYFATKNESKEFECALMYTDSDGALYIP